MPDVVVVGAGPVGTLLAGELARRSVDVAVLERRPHPGGGSRAIGVHAPVLAALEPSGITERLLAGAVRVGRGEARSAGRRLGVVRFDRLGMRFPFVATLPQHATEDALAHGAPPARRGTTVTSLAATGSGIRVSVADDDPLDASIVVLAGGSSARALAYRPGALRVQQYPDHYLMADAPVPASADSDVAVVHLDRGGVLESFPLPGGRRRFVAWDVAGSDEPDARTARLRDAVAARGEASSGIEGATSFRVRRVVAPRLRRSRLFVIGDGAHEVSPIGGQGMNLGLLDAATLAPLLAEWVRTGSAPDAQLARWERRRVASARTAGVIAAGNMALGRPAGAFGNAVRGFGLTLALAPPMGRLVAHTYAMGLDRDA